MEEAAQLLLKVAQGSGRADRQLAPLARERSARQSHQRRSAHRLCKTIQKVIRGEQLGGHVAKVLVEKFGKEALVVVELSSSSSELEHTHTPP